MNGNSGPADSERPPPVEGRLPDGTEVTVVIPGTVTGHLPLGVGWLYQVRGEDGRRRWVPWYHVTTTAGASGFDPDYTIGPAEMLRQWMFSRDVSVEDMAERCATLEVFTANTALAALRSLLDGQPMHAELPMVLAEVTGTNPDFWIRMESTYRDDLAAGKADMTAGGSDDGDAPEPPR